MYLKGWGGGIFAASTSPLSFSPTLTSPFSEDLEPDPKSGLCRIQIEATVKVTGQTGVEMEALTAVSVAALTIYDMCKAVDRSIYFTNIGLLHKSGGKSGTFTKERVGTSSPPK